MHNQATLGINQNGMMVPIQERPYYGRFGGMVTIHDETSNNIQFPRQEFVNPVFQGPTNTGPLAGFQPQEQNIPPMPNMFVPVQHEAQRNISPYTFDDRKLPS